MSSGRQNIAPFEEIHQISQQLEATLEHEFGATGRGLHEKVTSVESTLSDHISPAIVKKCRFIATIRNKATHEDTRIAADNINKVREAAQFVNTGFEEYRRRQQSSQSGCLSVFASVLLVAIASFLVFHIAFV